MSIQDIKGSKEVLNFVVDITGIQSQDREVCP